MDQEMKRNPKVLFVLKHRENTWGPYSDIPPNKGKGEEMSSGLFNSARFVCEALKGTGKVDAKLVHVQDNSFIDREVTLFRPDIVIIEAYWVVPSKFLDLLPLHPKVKWIIRNHSEIPFAAQEGVVMDWTIEYLRHPNVFVSANSYRSLRDMTIMVNSAFPERKDRVVFFPNIYAHDHKKRGAEKVEDEYLDAACFGAIRPLKNHLMQAIAALKFAELKGKKLRFHINGGRIEGAGSKEILKNLRMLFSKLSGHELVEHGWYPHEQFLEVLKTMDIGLQVSFSETFNIVGADMTHVGLPIVTSKEVLWSPRHTQADPTDSRDIIRKMLRVWWMRKLAIHQVICQRSLDNYSKHSLHQWLKEIEDLYH
jgi:hypothetical protein